MVRVEYPEEGGYLLHIGFVVALNYNDTVMVGK